MNWQEYQDAVGQLYEQLDSLGEVKKNVFLPDRVTGQLRQIDVWVTMKFGGHKLNILIDAKKYQQNLDVKDIEAVIELGHSVGANKMVIVTTEGWSKPAGVKAGFEGCDLRLLSISDALEIMIPEMWELCHMCKEDCIVLDQSGFTENNGLISWWLAGQCRSCKTAKVHCQDCGSKYHIEKGKDQRCHCGHLWTSGDEGVYLSFSTGNETNKVITIIDPDQLKMQFDNE